MRVEFTERIAASVEKVYAALQDPALIQRSIDGCESLTPLDADTYHFRLKVGGGPIKGKVVGRLRRVSARPPEAMTLEIEGKGLPGSIKATVEIRLETKGNGTELTGVGDVTVGGFLVALGSKMIETSGRAMMADFFLRFSAQLTASGS
jgi:uncharacterized protein